MSDIEPIGFISEDCRDLLELRHTGNGGICPTEDALHYVPVYTWPQVQAIEAAARAEGAREERGRCATAIEDQRHAWEEAAQVAGDRRDWDGTDNYEAMAEAAARLEGIVRSRAALSPHGEG